MGAFLFIDLEAIVGLRILVEQHMTVHMSVVLFSGKK